MKLGTSSKVTFGYVVLILLLLVSIFYVYDKLMLLERSEEAERSIVERRRAVNMVVSRLYEAEIVAQHVSMGKIANSATYQKAMKRAYHAIDSLRMIFSDRNQKQRLDSLKVLLGQKEKNMQLLINLINDSREQITYRTQINRIIEQQDTIIRQPKIQKKVVTDNQSYVVREKKKKGFFKRLAEAFSPHHEDSTEVNRMVQEVYVDTILPDVYNAADTLKDILKRAEDSLVQHKVRRTDLIRNRMREQYAAGAMISLKVTQLLETIEAEEQGLLNERMSKEVIIRQKATGTLAIISIVAMILAIGFSFFVWRDISQSNHYRKELEKAKKKAEDLLQVRESLMLTITHDIKAPVGSILGYIDLLSRLLQEKRAMFYVENMRSSAQHLLSLVTSLLDFHRLDANKMDIQKVTFNPKQLFETLYASFLPLAQKKGLNMVAEFDPALNAGFIGDPFRIRQITDNLISNALKFTETGRITLLVRLDGEIMHIAVRDTGCGMTLEEQEKVFKAFTRLASAQGQEGFGLGLSITKKLVGLMGGSIRIGSHVGHGTTFHVYLPVSRDVANVADETQISEKPILTQRLRIIMIDDDRIQMQLNQALFQSALGETNLELTCCTHPDELFHVLTHKEYDLLFTDIQMPAMNGFELLKTLRNVPYASARRMPVVAITARSDMSGSDFMRHGFAAVLYKPFSVEDLIRVIEDVMGMQIKVISDKNTSCETEIHDSADYSFRNLLVFADGDREASIQILRTFVEESEANVARINKALEHEDIRIIGEIAHKMLPSYTMLGAEEICRMLRYMESFRTAECLGKSDHDMILDLLGKIKKIIKSGEDEITAL